jgi:hypothetical protein
MPHFYILIFDFRTAEPCIGWFEVLQGTGQGTVPAAETDSDKRQKTVKKMQIPA